MLKSFMKSGTPHSLPIEPWLTVNNEMQFVWNSGHVNCILSSGAKSLGSVPNFRQELRRNLLAFGNNTVSRLRSAHTIGPIRNSPEIVLFAVVSAGPSQE